MNKIHILNNSVRFLIVYLTINVVMLFSATSQDQFPDISDSDPQTKPFPGQPSDAPSLNPPFGQPGSDSMGPPFSKTGPGRTAGDISPNPFPGKPGSSSEAPPFKIKSKTGPGKMPEGMSPQVPTRPFSMCKPRRMASSLYPLISITLISIS